MNDEKNWFIKVNILRFSTDTNVSLWYVIPKYFPNGQKVGMDSLKLTCEAIRDQIEEEFPDWEFIAAVEDYSKYSEYSEMVAWQIKFIMYNTCVVTKLITKD